jgi:hypothetical protein
MDPMDPVISSRAVSRVKNVQLPLKMCSLPKIAKYVQSPWFRTICRKSDA